MTSVMHTCLFIFCFDMLLVDILEHCFDILALRQINSSSIALYKSYLPTTFPFYHRFLHGHLTQPCVITRLKSLEA